MNSLKCMIMLSMEANVVNSRYYHPRESQALRSYIKGSPLSTHIVNVIEPIVIKAIFGILTSRQSKTFLAPSSHGVPNMFQFMFLLRLAESLRLPEDHLFWFRL